MITAAATNVVRANAIALLTDPKKCAENPGRRLSAFAVLKIQRGQTFYPDRIQQLNETGEVIPFGADIFDAPLATGAVK